MVMLRNHGSRFTVAAAFCAALIAVSASPAAATSQARAGIPAANPAALGSQPNVVIRDRVLPRRGGAHSAAVSEIIPTNASTGSYAANGMMIKIAFSPSYKPDAAKAQSWADFIGSLPQHGDASSLTAYFVPLREMQQLCGDGADACYDPNEMVLVLLTAPPPDGAAPEELIAHEFGHHIANNRDNAPWSADSWGPKRWATYEGICQGIANGTFFTDGADAHYEVDPSEGWAETYRAAAGQTPAEWPIVSDLFKHGEPAFRVALSDATSPWAGNSVQRTSGRFYRGRSKSQRVRIAVPLDGRVSVAVAAGRGMDIDLGLYDGSYSRPLASSARYGRKDGVAANVCGQRTAYVRLTLAKGSGSFKLTTSTPAP